MSEPYRWYDDPIFALAFANSPPTSGGATHRLAVNSNTGVAVSITAEMAGDGVTFAETVVVTAAQVAGADGGRWLTPGARFQSDTWPDHLDWFQVKAVALIGADGTLGDGSTVLNSTWNNVAVITDGYVDFDTAMSADGAPGYPKLTVAGVYTVYYGTGWTEA